MYKEQLGTLVDALSEAQFTASTVTGNAASYTFASYIQQARKELLELTAWARMVADAGREDLLDTGMSSFTAVGVVHPLDSQSAVLLSQHPQALIAEQGLRAISDPEDLASVLDGCLTEPARARALLTNTHLTEEFLRSVLTHPQLTDEGRSLIYSHPNLSTKAAYDLLMAAAADGTIIPPHASDFWGRVTANREPGDISLMISLLGHSDPSWASNYTATLRSYYQLMDTPGLTAASASPLPGIRNHALHTLSTRTDLDPSGLRSAVTGYLQHPLQPARRILRILRQFPDLLPVNAILAPDSVALTELTILHPDSDDATVKALLQRLSVQGRLDFLYRFADVDSRPVKIACTSRSGKVREAARDYAMRLWPGELFDVLDDNQQINAFRIAPDSQFVLMSQRMQALGDKDRHQQALRVALVNTKLSGQNMLNVITALQSAENADFLSDELPRIASRAGAYPQPEPLLAWLREHPNDNVRLALAGARGVSLPTLTALAADPVPQVAQKASASLIDATLR